MPRLTFIRPLSPSAAIHPPKGGDWLHEPCLDLDRVALAGMAAHVRCLPARKLGFLPITTAPLVGDHALTSC
jgi:hypothetical protein